jgi:hypothetical protein
MGWRGTVRTIAAASRRIERDQQRRHRELLKHQQQLAKLQANQRAALEVEIHENHLDLLTSVHKECSEVWDWQQIENSPQPTIPECSNRLELAQRQRNAQHPPGFIDRLLGRPETKRAAAEKAIEEAIAADKRDYSSAIAEYETMLADWKALQTIARGVLSDDVTAFREALEEIKPFNDIRELGRSVHLNFNDQYVEATITLHGLEHIPTETKSLLKTGKVSIKKMSPSAVNDLYEKHCCSCLLRAARELFAVLPFKCVYAHGLTELLNPQTGHKELKTVVSVCIPRATFETLNLESIDPADAMHNFIFRIDFAKTRGFAAVEKIDPKTIKSHVS